MRLDKARQVYGHTLLRWLCGLFGAPCESYLQIPGSLDTDRITCVKSKGHNSRHEGVDEKCLYYPQGGKITWGIGDNLV